MIITGGQSPQVVTETVWALATKRTPAFVPDRIVVCLSGYVQPLYERMILSDEGKLAELCKELGLPSLNKRTRLVVPVLPSRQIVEDIRSAEDVACFGDMIAAVVQEER